MKDREFTHRGKRGQNKWKEHEQEYEQTTNRTCTNIKRSREVSVLQTDTVDVIRLFFES